MSNLDLADINIAARRRVGDGPTNRFLRLSLTDFSRLRVVNGYGERRNRKLLEQAKNPVQRYEDGGGVWINGEWKELIRSCCCIGSKG